MTPTDHPSVHAAFVAAQAQFTHVVASKQGQARAATFRYADLADLVEMARPVLAAHGLAFQSHNGHADGGVTCETVIVHATGGELRSGPTFIAVPDDAGAQAFGSAYTYARRYSLLAMLGIAADDDDGVAAMQAQAAKVERAQHAAAAPKLSDEQVACIAAIVKPCGFNFTANGKLAEDYPVHVKAAVDLAVKQGALHMDLSDKVTNAAIALDFDSVTSLLAGGEVAA